MKKMIVFFVGSRIYSMKTIRFLSKIEAFWWKFKLFVLLGTAKAE